MLKINKKARLLRKKYGSQKNITFTQIDNFTQIEKDIIFLMGNHIKIPPIESNKNSSEDYISLAKDKIMLESILKEKYSKKQIKKTLKKLYNLGIITFTRREDTLNTGIIDNNEAIKAMFEDDKKIGKKYYEKHGVFPIRLTNPKERKVSGKKIYIFLMEHKTLNQISYFKKSLVSMDKKQKEITNKINNFYTKIIEIITIFIAVFSLILINYNLLSNLLNKNIVDNLSLIFIINGSLSLILTNLFLFIHKIIYQEEDNKKWLQFYLPNLLFILIGILILNT